MNKNYPNDLDLKYCIDDLEQLGLLIRQARKASGLSIVEAAASIGIAKQTLSDLERGRGSVGIQIVLKVIHEFGLRVLVTSKKELEIIWRNNQLPKGLES